MIYPQNNKPVRWFFHQYIHWIIRRNFKQVNFNRFEVDKSRSVLLLANHFSWWDGFILYYLNAKLFNKKFHIMVLEETMQKVGFFKYLGAFSVSKNSRDMITSLTYAANLLSDPQNMVVIFPQGKLHSNFITHVHFEKGILKVAEDATGKFQLITSASFAENLQYKKPAVNIYLNIIEPATFENIAELNDIYQQHYNAAHQQQIQIVL